MTTFGIEEEFMFLDPVSLQPADVAADVFNRLSASPEWAAVTHREFLAAQVEHASAVFSGLDEAKASLLGFRRELTFDAERLGVIAASVGTPPDARPFPTITAQARYQRIVEDMAGIIADHQMSGLHVHIGLPDRESGVTALNAARPWLPLLLALSGNSAFWRGYDTGYASWRYVQQRRWTSSGCPPVFRDAADYDRRLGRLLGIGGMKDRAIIMWDIRLSEHLPTIEFRVADAQLDVWPTLLIAALCRALVSSEVEGHWATDAAATRSADVPPELLSAALMHSAHAGLRGDVFDPVTGVLAPAADVLRGFLHLLEPALDAAGDLPVVTESVDRILRDGTGADRQRAAFESGGFAELRVLFESRLTADD